MTMTLDASQQRFPSVPFHDMAYVRLPPFSDPWAPSKTSTTAYPSVPERTSPMAGVYAAAPAAPPPLPPPPPQHVLGLGSRMSHTQHPSVTSAAAYASPGVSAAYAAPPAPYNPMGYAAGRYPALHPQHHPQHPHHQHHHQHHHHHHHDDRRSFQDALEASHGMLSTSQDTPRNIYDVRQGQRVVAAAAAAASRVGSSPDGYGFPPAPHSASSSLSSSTGFSAYYGGGSVDGSVSDYSTGASDIESLSGRLPARAPALLPAPSRPGASAHPPAPQSMMGSFSSRVQSGKQKKHKCQVCDKRFMRPSSLQTHVYCHTGEKPFACDVDGCGRRFSVVSNLRRHRKVHRGPDAASSAESAPAGTSSNAASEDRAGEGHAVKDHAVEDHAVEDHAVEDVAVEGDAVENLAVEGHASEAHAVEDHASEDPAVKDPAVKDHTSA